MICMHGLNHTEDIDDKLHSAFSTIIIIIIITNNWQPIYMDIYIWANKQKMHILTLTD